MAINASRSIAPSVRNTASPHTRPAASPKTPGHYVPAIKQDIASVLGTDTLNLTQKGAIAPKQQVQLFADSGFQEVQTHGGETKAELRFMDMLTNENPVQTAVPLALGRLDIAIQKLISRERMQDIAALFSGAMPQQGLRRFMQKCRDPQKLMDILARPGLSPDLQTVQEGGRVMQKKVMETGFTTLARSVQRQDPQWTPQRLQGFLEQYAKDQVRHRVLLWVDTNNFQNFEGETERILEEFQEEFSDTEEGRSMYRKMVGDMALEQPPVHKAELLARLTREKLLEPLLVDLIRRGVYKEHEERNNLVFVASRLCDSKGVDLYVADPDRAGQYLAIDITSSKDGYYRKKDTVAHLDRRGASYDYDNFVRYTHFAAAYEDQGLNVPMDIAGAPVDMGKGSSGRIHKEIVYLDALLWNELLHTTIQAIGSNTYESGNQINMTLLEETFAQAKRTHQGKWASFDTLQEYLLTLLRSPETLAP